MPTISALTTFSANTKIKSAEVNANFSSIRTTVNTYAAFVDDSATITGAWTFSTAPTFSTAQTFGAAVTITTGGLTVSAGGITVTGNSTVTGTLTATTFSGSGASLTNIPAANLTGTLPAISGANLTSLNASNLASGTVSVDRLPTTYSTVITFSSGPVISNAQTLSFPSTAGAAGSVPALSVASDYNTTGGLTTPAMTNAPLNGSWRWIRVLINGATVGYIPAVTA